MTLSKPVLTGTSHELPFDKLSPRDFERLCLWLVEREGFGRAEHLGAAGSEQGRDVIAWRGDELWYFQCKRYRSIGAATLKGEVDKYLQLAQEKPHLKPVGVVFVTSCIVSAQAREAVGAYCDEHGLTYEFWAATELDEKVKRHSDIVEEFFQPSAPSLWDRLRQRPFVLYPTLALAASLVIFALVAGLISMGADIGGAREQLREWGLLPTYTPTATPTPTPTTTPTPLPFAPARENETLIIIASFYHSEGIPDTEIHNEIRQSIQEAAAELGLSQLRVEVEPTPLQADDGDEALLLGQRYNASIVIWGADTGVRVTVNYLNLKQPDLAAARVRISETEFTQLANPNAYASFITQDMPSQITFLSLFAVGRSFFTEERYIDSIKVIEKAIDSLASETEPVDGLASAYFYLGWLYQEPMDDDQQAIIYYSKAVELAPDYATAYNNRGIARMIQGDLEGATSDFAIAAALDPSLVVAYALLTPPATPSAAPIASVPTPVPPPTTMAFPGPPGTGVFLTENGAWFCCGGCILLLLVVAGAGAWLWRHRKRKSTGRPWTEEEEQRLIADYDAGDSMEKLTTKYQRTEGAIKARLVRLGRIEPD
jgi:tetratricopeptide (TPR) repeat protein